MPTYTPVNKTYAIWNKDPVNSVDITNFVFQDTVNVSHHTTFSSSWTAGAEATWTPGSEYTGSDTLISKTKTYESHVGDISTATASTNYFKGHTPFTQAYTTSSGDKLQVDSTTTVGQLVTIGMAITGGGYTGQTVTAFSATVGWMVLSAVGPVTLPAVGTPLTFTDPFPPTLKLVSTATLYTGMIMNGNGFTAGQTVVSIGTDSTVVASADPNTGVYAGAIVTFQPPAYVLKVNNITGLSAGWTVDPDAGGFVYSVSRSIISTSGTQYLIMSGDVGYANPSGDIKFISNQNTMITLAPNSSATWVMYYSANNGSTTNNLPIIKIYSKQNGNISQKTVTNVAAVNQAPSITNLVPPDIISRDGGGGRGWIVTVDTQTFTSDNADINSTLTTVTTTDTYGNIISITYSATPAINFSVAAATDGVAQVAAAEGTNAATAAAVNAAVAQANADAAAALSAAVQGQDPASLAQAAQSVSDAAAANSAPSGATVGTGSAVSAANGNAGLGVSAGGDGSSPAPGSGANATCFVKGSLVTLADKTKIAIEDVKIGDKVLGLNGINTVTGYDRPMLIIDKVRSGTVYGINGLGKFVTSEHPILTNNGWKAIDIINAILFEPHLAKLLVGNLEIGDKILTEHGNYITINSIEKYEDQPQQELYNLLLDGDHTFYLNDLLVHNKGDSCFDPMAKVTMHDGSHKYIKDILVNDLVMNQTGVSNKVIGIEAPSLANRLMYSFNEHWAFVSEEHPILTTSGWAAFNPNSWAVEKEFVGKLNKIEIGTEIITKNGTELVTKIQEHVLPKEYKIYNLILDGDHTYIVENCVVHNKKGIVCTAMNDHYGFGSFRNRIWLKYAEKNLTKAHEVGYHTIFLPLVDYGFKQGNSITHRMVRKTLEHIARHRSTDIRAEMRGLKRNTLGRAYRFVLEPVCYIVGKLKGF